MEQIFEIVARMLGLWDVRWRAGAPAWHAREDIWPNIAIGDRVGAIQRIGYLLPALTDEALAAVLAVAEAAPKRALDSGTLAEEQQAREGAGLPPCGKLWAQPAGGAPAMLCSLQIEHSGLCCPTCKGGACVGARGLIETSAEHDREVARGLTGLEESRWRRYAFEIKSQRDALKAQLAAFTAPVDVKAEVERRSFVILDAADGIGTTAQALPSTCARVEAALRPHVEREAQLAREVERLSALKSAEVAPIEPCKACACERDGVCNHGSPHTCEGLPHDMDAMAESAARSILAPLQEDVDDAARRLGLCVFAEGSVEHQARAKLFEALGRYTGSTPAPAVEHRSLMSVGTCARCGYRGPGPQHACPNAPAVPPIVADVENDGDRGPRGRSCKFHDDCEGKCR